jgi:hypothetical protein
VVVCGTSRALHHINGVRRCVFSLCFTACLCIGVPRTALHAFERNGGVVWAWGRNLLNMHALHSAWQVGATAVRLRLATLLLRWIIHLPCSIVPCIRLAPFQLCLHTSAHFGSDWCHQCKLHGFVCRVFLWQLVHLPHSSRLKTFVLVSSH